MLAKRMARTVSMASGERLRMVTRRKVWRADGGFLSAFGFAVFEGYRRDGNRLFGEFAGVEEDEAAPGSTIGGVRGGHPSRNHTLEDAAGGRDGAVKGCGEARQG